MPPINVTLTFENETELRAWLDRDAQADSPASDDSQADEPARAPETDAEPTAASETVADPDQPTRDDTDADGMPYDEAVHSDPPSFTADGLWRARRGKAEEAKAARAAFKAGGGDETPPEDVETRADAAPTAPGAPAPVADAPAPVTIEALFGKIAMMLEDGSLDRGDLFGIYRESTGIADTVTDNDLPAAVTPIYQVNETARANAMAALNAI